MQSIRMAQFKKETPDEAAFRREMEQTKSTQDTVYSATLPEGTDYYVRALFAVSRRKY